MNVVALPLDMIDPGERLREVDEEQARLMAISMAQDGQRMPIEVCALRGGEAKHRLIAGAHRLRALELAGFDTALAFILDVGDLHARRMEIEENLLRYDLTELDRSAFLARWKSVHEEINAGTGHGKKKNKRKVGEFSNFTIERFTKVAAARLNLSEAVIQKAERRHRKLSPEARKLISGTWLADHGSELDLLTRLVPEKQADVVRAMREQGATTIRDLVYRAMNRRTPEIDPDTAQFDAVMKAWRKASAKARARFRAELAKDDQFNLGDAA